MMMKKENNLFGKHRSRLILEGALRAALWGVLIGASANCLAALAAWLLDFGGVLFAVGVGAAVALVSGLLFYFLRYRPNTMDIARRVDRLGLEERMITMVELMEDDSYLARFQREDAKQHLQESFGQRLSLHLSGLMIALACVAFLLGGGMTTVVGLAAGDVIPSGPELINPEDPMAMHIAVTYFVEEGGEIQGEADQLLLPGEDATPVVAVAQDGWVFVGWDDGGKDPARQDTGITEELFLTALFEELMEGEDGDGDGEKNENAGGGEEGDKAEDLPEGGEAQVENGDPNGGQGDKGSGSGSDGDSEGAKGEGDEQGEGKGDGQGLGAGGKWSDANQFIDGETYYRDHKDMYYQMAQEIFEANGEIPPELREFFETYFDSI